MPISGRPPSLIKRPSGCHFHPRCPYVRDEHKRIDPRLEPVTGDPGHAVACLLSSELRSRIWHGLTLGESSATLRHLVVEDEHPVRAHAVPRVSEDGPV